MVFLAHLRQWSDKKLPVVVISSSHFIFSRIILPMKNYKTNLAQVFEWRVFQVCSNEGSPREIIQIEWKLIDQDVYFLFSWTNGPVIKSFAPASWYMVDLNLLESWHKESKRQGFKVNHVNDKKNSLFSFGGGVQCNIEIKGKLCLNNI